MPHSEFRAKNLNYIKKIGGLGFKPGGVLDFSPTV